jgi:hypothetical protein
LRVDEKALGVTGIAVRSEVTDIGMIEMVWEELRERSSTKIVWMSFKFDAICTNSAYFLTRTPVKSGGD